MDGGGRLDQPLMRSGQSAAKQVGAPVDEPSRTRASADQPRRRESRFAGLSGYRRLTGRWAARIAHLPRGAGVAGSILLIAAALGYGAVAGQHVPAVIDWFKDARDVAANALGFRIAAISLTGEKEVSREEVLTTAGVTGRASLLFLDADARAHAADGESVDRRCRRAQALSGPPADHDHRAARFCALAEGRPAQRHRRRRHGARAVRRGPLSRPAAGRRHVAPNARPRIFSPSSTVIRTSGRRCARRSWWPSGAGICG